MDETFGKMSSRRMTSNPYLYNVPMEDPIPLVIVVVMVA